MDFVFEIKKHLATLRTSNTGWTRELNLVSWNGAPPRYDIRDWSPDKEQMTKGVTLTEEDAIAVANAIMEEVRR